MGTITKIKDFYAEKLNNYEYAYFTTEFLSLVKATTAAKLHVTQNVVDTYEADANKLTDFTRESRISDETAKIADIDKQTDDLIVAIFDIVRSNKKSPLATRKAAATELYNALKPYVGCYQLAQRQEVQAVRGMLTDLAKEKLAAHVTALGLDDVVEALTESVEQYAALLLQREEGKANSVGVVKKVRASLEEQFDYITTVAFAFSVAEPSEELDNFIKKTNLLIDSANHAYNLRTGTKGGKEEDPTVTDPNEPEESVKPEITEVYSKVEDVHDPTGITRGKETIMKWVGDFELVNETGDGPGKIIVKDNFTGVEEVVPVEDILSRSNTGCEFIMIRDFAEGEYKIRIETYDGGSPLTLEYGKLIKLV